MFMFGRVAPEVRESVTRHLKAEHGQGLPKRLMNPTGELKPPSTAPAARLETLVAAAPRHVPPRVDVYGFPLPEPPPAANCRRVKSFSDQGVPKEWEAKPRFSSNTELKAARRLEMRPHGSYDLDGDGFVSQRDYNIAKQFDARSKEPTSYGTSGRLTAQEQRAAIAEDMGRRAAELSAEEMTTSIRGTHVLSSLSREPELDAARRGPSMSTNVRDVTNMVQRSSRQAKDCMTLPLGPPPRAPGERLSTRGELRATRRDTDIQRAQQGYIKYMDEHPTPSYSLPAPQPLQPGRAATRSQLKASQREALAPSLSYDLDGDGSISQLDLRTARQYERSKETGLTPRERTEARHDLARQYGAKLAVASSPTKGQDGLHGSLARQHLELFESEPEGANAGTMLRQAGFYSRLAEMRSSALVNGCLAGSERPPDEMGMSRTAMMHTRRTEAQTANRGLDGRLTASTAMPQYTRPGAPGKNPLYKKFSRFDVAGARKLRG